MLAHLNLYRELKHLVHMDQTIKEDRKWKVSKIDAFGSNIAFVLHRYLEICIKGSGYYLNELQMRGKG